jgi:hypothetical protein
MNLTPTALAVAPRKALVGLLIVSVALGAASLLGQYFRFFHGIDNSRFENFDLEEEANFPTYWSSLLLLVAACLLAVIARLRRLAADPMFSRWRVLAVIFFVLSMDEVVGIHEESGRLVPDGIDVLGGILYYGWVIPTGIAVAIVGLYFVPLFRALPDPDRGWFVASAAIYVGGALAVELVEGVVAIRTGDETWWFQLVATVQEVSEMIGISLFIWALLKFIERREPVLRATVEVGD